MNFQENEESMMEENQLIATLERQTMLALPAREHEQMNGWHARYTDGYTKRANSIYPLKWDREDKALEYHVIICEKWYGDRLYPAVYKMTDYAQPNHLDDFLEARNYVKQDETSVQILPYHLYNEEEVSIQVLFSNDWNERWFQHVCLFNQLNEKEMAIFKTLLLRIHSETCYALVADHKGKVLACGLGVLEDEYFGLYDIVTNKAYRNQGIGRQLVHALLQWGRNNGAQLAYLQVVQDNIPAQTLYKKIGFAHLYTYWYRIQQIEG